jgi:hypothetical protein
MGQNWDAKSKSNAFRRDTTRQAQNPRPHGLTGFTPKGVTLTFSWDGGTWDKNWDNWDAFEQLFGSVPPAVAGGVFHTPWVIGKMVYHRRRRYSHTHMKKLIFRTLFIVSLCAVLFPAAFGQGFPWESFTQRTLKELTDLTKKEFRSDDTMYFRTKLLETKSEVTFTGKSRPIDKGASTFLQMWSGMLGFPESYVQKYQREFLYKEGENEYWLPTQEPITKYFDKELKPGDKMMLYLVSTGAHGVGKDINCVLLVEEYQVITPPKTS